MEKFKDSKYIFVVGIGGSDLASKAVWNALTLHKKTEKKLFFLEALDSREYEEVRLFIRNEVVSSDDICLIVVSKSGKTEETLETFHQTFEMLSEKFGALTDRILVITSVDSPLSKLADEKRFEKIGWEGEVSGRFSAFTIAHTIVLEIAGLNAQKFKEGSEDIKKTCEEGENEAVLLAEEVFENYKRGVNIWDFFFFNSELEDLGKWARQLVAESIALITPTVTLGPTDLHSMLELYLGGPKNRFTLFVRSLKEIKESINNEAFENVTAAYKKAELPFQKFELPEINEYEIGQFMQYMMLVVIELGKLLEINIYDQPAVDKYKFEIRSTKSETNSK